MQIVGVKALLMPFKLAILSMQFEDSESFLVRGGREGGGEDGGAEEVPSLTRRWPEWRDWHPSSQREGAACTAALLSLPSGPAPSSRPENGVPGECVCDACVALNDPPVSHPFR